MPFLRGCVACAKSTKCRHGTVGVFWPYMCLPSSLSASPTRELASGALEAGSMPPPHMHARWYSLPTTHVVQLERIPRVGRHLHAEPYEARGWQEWEARIASLLKYEKCLWSTASGAGGDTYEACLQCLAARRPPMSPTRWATHVRSGGGGTRRIRFANAGECERAIELYTVAFVAAFESFATDCPGRSNIYFTDAGWGDEEVQLVAEALSYAAAHCQLSSRAQLTIHLKDGNRISKDGWTVLQASVSGSGFRVK